jgi:hypothetical protein
MAAYDLELLQQADEAHREAGAAFDQTYQELLAEQSQEWRAGEERVARYNEAFAGGLVIEKVVHPSQLEYYAGGRERWAGLFEHLDDEPVWLEVDRGHALRLKGLLATEVKIDDYHRLGRQISEADKPQRDLGVRFEVAGMQRNRSQGNGIHRRDKDTTRYSAESLSAIKWRLPNEEEIKNFGAVATEAAA